MNNIATETPTAASATLNPESKESESFDPYKNSVALKKLRNSQKGRPQIFATDIDSTITGDPDKTKQLRSDIESNSEVFIEITSRTEEMMLSENAASKSSQLKRDPPKLGDSDGKKVYVDPAKLVNPGLIDPDIVAGSTGTRILVKQEDGSYLPDEEFGVLMKSESVRWRTVATRLVEIINGQDNLCEFAKIEDPNNYLSGEVDVFPPDFRIQLNFKGKTAEEKIAAKKTFYEKLRELKSNPQKRKEIVSELSNKDENFMQEMLNTRLTDDSDVKKNEIQSYLSPTKGFKARALDYLTTKLYEKSGLSKGRIQTNYFGDSITDLATGLLSGDVTTFVLAGGSRLSQKLIDAQKTQASLKKLSAEISSRDELEEIAEQMDSNAIDFAGEGLNAIGRRLTPFEGKPGYYIFKPPLKPPRIVIILDETLPGKIKSDSIQAFHSTSTSPP